MAKIEENPVDILKDIVFLNGDLSFGAAEESQKCMLCRNPVDSCEPSVRSLKLCTCKEKRAKLRPNFDAPGRCSECVLRGMVAYWDSKRKQQRLSNERYYIIKCMELANSSLESLNTDCGKHHRRHSCCHQKRKHEKIHCSSSDSEIKSQSRIMKHHHHHCDKARTKVTHRKCCKSHEVDKTPEIASSMIQENIEKRVSTMNLNQMMIRDKQKLEEENV